MLVVDDDPAIVESVRVMLSDAYHVITTTSGSDALEIVRRTSPDLILLDVLMPGLDGVAVLRGLKRAGSDVPVIMMSGLDYVSLAVTAMRDGAVDFLRKPLGGADLTMLIEDALTRRERGTSPAARPRRPSVSPALLVSREVGVLAAIFLALGRELPIALASSAAAVLRYPPRSAPHAVVIDPRLPARESLLLVQMVRGPWRSRLVFADMMREGAVPSMSIPAGAYLLHPADLQQLLEQLAGVVSSEAARVRPPQYRPPVQRAIGWLTRNYQGRVSAPLVARASGISLRQLADVFRADTGLSLMHYLTRLRAHVACCLLAEPHLRLEVVAEAAGFSDASHLSRVFLQELGQRPGHYRRSLLEPAPIAGVG